MSLPNELDEKVNRQKEQILDLSSSVDRNTTVTYSRIPYLNNCSPKSFVIIAQQLRVVPS